MGCAPVHPPHEQQHRDVPIPHACGRYVHTYGCKGVRGSHTGLRCKALTSCFAQRGVVSRPGCILLRYPRQPLVDRVIGCPGRLAYTPKYWKELHLRSHNQRTSRVACENTQSVMREYNHTSMIVLSCSLQTSQRSKSQRSKYRSLQS